MAASHSEKTNTISVSIPEHENPDRAMMDVILQLGRTLTVEVQQKCQYSATRVMATPYDLFLRHYHDRLNAASIISRQIWEQAAPFLDDASRALLLVIEFYASCAPACFISVSVRQTWIKEAEVILDQFNNAMRDLRDPGSRHSTPLKRNTRNSLVKQLAFSLRAILETDILRQCSYALSLQLASPIPSREDNPDEGLDCGPLIENEEIPSLDVNQVFYADSLAGLTSKDGENFLFIMNLSFPPVAVPPQILSVPFDAEDDDYLRWLSTSSCARVSGTPSPNQTSWVSYCIHKYCAQRTDKNRQIYQHLHGHFMPILEYCNLGPSGRFIADDQDGKLSFNPTTDNLPEDIWKPLPLCVSMCETLMCCLIDLTCRSVISDSICSRYLDEILMIMNQFGSPSVISDCITFDSHARRASFLSQRLDFLHSPNDYLYYDVTQATSEPGVVAVVNGVVVPNSDKIKFATAQQVFGNSVDVAQKRLCDVPPQYYIAPKYLQGTSLHDDPSCQYDQCDETGDFSALYEQEVEHVTVKDTSYPLNFAASSFHPIHERLTIPKSEATVAHQLDKFIGSNPALRHRKSNSDLSGNSETYPADLSSHGEGDEEGDESLGESSLFASSSNAHQFGSDNEMDFMTEEIKLARMTAKAFVVDRLLIPQQEHAALMDTSGGGLGSSMMIRIQSATDRHADAFVGHFMNMLEMMGDHMVGAIAENYAKSYRLVDTVVLKKPDLKHRLLRKFASISSSVNSDLAVFMNCAKLVRTVHYAVQSAKLAHDQQVLVGGTTPPNSTVSSSSSPDTFVNRPFDPEQLRPLSDMGLRDLTPTVIVTDRFARRYACRLSKLASSIDQQLESDEAMVKNGIKLSLQECLSHLAAEEMKNEDDEHAADMRALDEAYAQFKAPSKESWIDFITTPVEILPHSLSGDISFRDMEWFKIPLYKRILLVKCWYPTEEDLDLCVEQTKLPKSCKNLYFAPLSSKRKPTLLDETGPLSRALTLLHLTCKSCMQYDTKYVTEALKEAVRSLTNEHAHGAISKVIHFSPSTVISKDDNTQMDMCKWDLREDVDDDAPLDGSIFERIGSLVVTGAARIKKAILAWGEESNTPMDRIVTKAVLLLAEVVTGANALQVLARVSRCKSRTRRAWVAYAKAREAHPTNARQLGLMLSKSLLPHATFTYASAHFCSSTKKMEGAIGSIQTQNESNWGRNISMLAPLLLTSITGSSAGEDRVHAQVMEIFKSGRENNMSVMETINMCCKQITLTD